MVEERRIRWDSLNADSSLIEYNVGDYIEVRHKTAEDEPEGWCLAKIIHKRDDFYFVHYENYENIYDEIVMRCQIRPVNARGGPSIEEVERHSTEVPATILNWCTTADCDEKLLNIIAKTKVYNVSYRPIENTIVVVGEVKPVKKASVLIKFILDHQFEIAQLDNENIKMSKNLESKKHKIKSDSVEEVLVPKELLGLIIGKGGSNITYVKQEFGVGIHIIEYNDEESKEYTNSVIPEDKALLRIYGKDPKWVAKAKKEICLQKEYVPIPIDKIEYVKGYQNALINDMKEKSGCVKLFMHDAEKKATEGMLEIIGNEDALETLHDLLDTHLSYFDTYHEKEITRGELSKQMNKINTNYGDNFYAQDGQRAAYNPNARRNKPKKY